MLPVSTLRCGIGVEASDFGGRWSLVPVRRAVRLVTVVPKTRALEPRADGGRNVGRVCKPYKRKSKSEPKPLKSL